MTALAANRAGDSRQQPGAIYRYPVAASTTIYAGSLVMLNATGYLVPASATANNKGVVGVARKKVDNSAGSDGDLWADAQEGVYQFAASTLTQAQIGDIVYAEDDQTVDTEPGINEPIAGRLVEYVSASSGYVAVGPQYLEGLDLRTRVAITSAEILLLFTTAKTLVAAPGAGRVLEFLSAMLVLDYGTATYATNGDITVSYTNISGTAVSDTAAEADFLFDTNDHVHIIQALSADIEMTVNAALVLSIATGNAATGDGTMIVETAYRVHSTGL